MYRSHKRDTNDGFRYTKRCNQSQGWTLPRLFLGTKEKVRIGTICCYSHVLQSCLGHVKWVGGYGCNTPCVMRARLVEAGRYERDSRSSIWNENIRIDISREKPHTLTSCAMIAQTFVRIFLFSGCAGESHISDPTTLSLSPDVAGFHDASVSCFFVCAADGERVMSSYPPPLEGWGVRDSRTLLFTPVSPYYPT